MKQSGAESTNRDGAKENGGFSAIVGVQGTVVTIPEPVKANLDLMKTEKLALVRKYYESCTLASKAPKRMGEILGCGS